MAELDTIHIENPLNEDFEVRFNGEPYTLKQGEKRQLPQHLARHFAKHMSDRMCALEFEKQKQVYEKRKEKIPDPLKTQITMYDNPERRIALYKCLRSKEEVERTIKSYPQFKAMDKGFNFVGDIKVYDDFVLSQLSSLEEVEPSVPESPVSSEEPMEPPKRRPGRPRKVEISV